MRVVTGDALHSRRKAGVLVAVLGVSLCAAALALFSGVDRNADIRFDPVTTPSLAVLGLQPPRMMLLDPASLEVQHTIALRSESLDVDSHGGYLVSAQCGGPGPASDTAVCVIEPLSGSVTYVDTGFLDPEQLCPPRTGEDRWPVLHGQAEEETPLSVTVDPRNGAVEPFSLPVGTVLLERVGGNHLVVAMNSAGTEAKDARYGLWISNGESFEPLPHVLPAVASVWDEGDSALIVCARSDSVQADVYRLDPSRALERELTITGFTKGPGAVTECDGFVAVADFDWRDPLDAGEAILLARTDGEGSDARRVTGLAGPIQLVSHDGSVFVVCSTTGEIARVDPLTARVEARVGIGAPGTDLIDAAIWRPE